MDAKVLADDPFVFNHPDGPVHLDWSSFELLHYLLHSHWDFNLIPKRTSRATVAPYIVGHDASKKEIRYKLATKSLNRYYLLALAQAEAGVLGSGVEVHHLRAEKYYKKLLGIEAKKPLLALTRTGADVLENMLCQAMDMPDELVGPQSPGEDEDSSAVPSGNETESDGGSSSLRAASTPAASSPAASACIGHSW